MRALLARPRLLLLDEPSLGLAPLLADDIFAIIRDVHRDGMSILLVEQNAYRALELADRAWVIETGLVALAGSGTVSVTITSANGLSRMAPMALPVSSPWVIIARTERAPASATAWAMLQSVPPV